MATIVRWCPYCTTSFQAGIGQHNASHVLCWYESRICTRCPYHVEVDGDYAWVDVEVRTAILEQDGAYMLHIEARKEVRMQMMQHLRSLFNTPLAMVGRVLTYQESALITGTYHELRWIVERMQQKHRIAAIADTKQQALFMLNINQRGQYNVALNRTSR